VCIEEVSIRSSKMLVAVERVLMDTNQRQIALSVLESPRDDLMYAHLNNGGRVLDVADLRQYTMPREGQIVHVSARTCRAFWGPGDMYTFLVTGEQTGGAYFVMEALVPPGGGPPTQRR